MLRKAISLATLLLSEAGPAAAAEPMAKPFSAYGAINECPACAPSRS